MHLYEQIIPILTVYAYDVGSVGRINLFLGNFFFIFLYLQVLVYLSIQSFAFYLFFLINLFKPTSSTLKHFLILFNTIIFMTHF